MNTRNELLLTGMRIKNFPYHPARIGKNPNWDKLRLRLNESERYFIERILAVEGVSEMVLDKKKGITLCKSKFFPWRIVGEKIKLIIPTFDTRTLPPDGEIYPNEKIIIEWRENEDFVGYEINRQICKTINTLVTRENWEVNEAALIANDKLGPVCNRIADNVFQQTDFGYIIVSPYKIRIGKNANPSPAALTTLLEILSEAAKGIY